MGSDRAATTAASSVTPVAGVAVDRGCTADASLPRALGSPREDLANSFNASHSGDPWRSALDGGDVVSGAWVPDGTLVMRDEEELG
jgi:hypothetical protein